MTRPKTYGEFAEMNEYSHVDERLLNEVLDDFRAAIKHDYETKRFCEAHGMLDDIKLSDETQL